MRTRQSSPLPGALVLITLLAAGAAAHAQIYRWVDERGVVHYGERPPSGVVPRPVEDKKATAPAAAPKADADLGQREREFQQRRIDRELGEKQAREGAERIKAQCARERQRLAQLRDAGRVVTGIDEKGERRYLDDADRAETIRSLEAVIAQRCA